MLTSEIRKAPETNNISDSENQKMIMIRRINIYDSPILSVTKGKQTVHLVLDTGATASLISLEKASELKLRILPTKHKAIQVDGISQLKVIGEVHTEFKRGDLSLNFSGLVVNRLGTAILAGTNFHRDNDVYCRMSLNKIVIKGIHVYQSTPVEVLKFEKTPKARLVKVDKSKIVIPGDLITLKLPSMCTDDATYVVEPKLDQGKVYCEPQIVTADKDLIQVEVKGHDEFSPVRLKKNASPIQVREVTKDDESELKMKPPDSFMNIQPKKQKQKSFEDKMKDINLDQAGTMSKEEKQKFINTCKQFEEVFNNDLPGYNGYYGKVKPSITFASKARPTSHKSRMPNYGSIGQHLYNKKIITMFQKGVLIDPFQLGIQPKIVNDSWVVKKQSSAHKSWEECDEKDVRVVTGFDPVNKYLSPVPSKATDPMSIYSNLANWQYLGELDFKDFHWQLPFGLETMKEKRQLEYLCVRTVSGTMAYARGPNGLLGMDAYSDELTDRLMGDLVLKGKVAKLADNVYLGGKTMNELHEVFHEILKRCKNANLRMKPEKIRINIASADILGLHWNRGTLSPSTHKLDPLSVCQTPSTVKGLRSYLGAVRFNEICLNSKDLANATEKLDALIPATKAGKEKIIWNDELSDAFKAVQEICKQPQTIYVPKKGDHLYIVGDAAPSHGPGIGSKLIIKREGYDRFLPSFNHGMRIKNSMKSWSTCEVESYNIANAIKKFKPFIRFVETRTTALMDSRASVLAVQRLEKGQPSTSRRLQDLLANVSAENIQINHISAKLPSAILEYVDYASRHPIECENESCTICSESEHPDITYFGSTNVENEEVNLPHITLNMWRDIQSSSPDLRKAAALMEAGKKPHKKDKRTTNVSRYLRYCTLDKNGLVIAKDGDKRQPFLLTKTTRIVIPQEFSYTYATVLHRKFNHPNKSQMLRMFNRNFFMLNVENVISKITDNCEYPCKAMKKLPKEMFEYQTETKPLIPGVCFNADVLQEASRKILILRDNLTSYSEAMIIRDETKQTLREALIILTSKLRMDKEITIRVDAQSALKSLQNDKTLKSELIHLDIGSAKNRNKNAVAEKCIRELREELVKQEPSGRPITETTLAKAVKNLNFRIRFTGCSSKELWVKRNQNSGLPLEFTDSQLSDAQYKMRINSHKSSAKYESRHAKKVELPALRIGDRVYVKSDGSKSKARDPYVVLQFIPNKNEILAQKITDRKNKKNIVTIQIQNLYKVNNDQLVYSSENEEPSFSVRAEQMPGSRL